MQCTQCEFENPEGLKFCGECGAPLKSRCPQCGFDNPPRFKFCGECGTPLTEQSRVRSLASRVPPPPPPRSYTPRHLAERILAEQAAMEARGVTDGERKTITALFADTKDLQEAKALLTELEGQEKGKRKRQKVPRRQAAAKATGNKKQ